MLTSKTKPVIQPRMGPAWDRMVGRRFSAVRGMPVTDPAPNKSYATNLISYPMVNKK